MGKTCCENMSLDDADIFALIFFTSSKMEQIADQYIYKPLGLSKSTFDILHILSTKKSATATELLSFVGGTRSNISQRIDWLEKNNWVTRKLPTGNTDRRKIVIQLTPFAAKKMSKFESIVEESRVELEKNISDQEIKIFRKVIKKIHSKLDEFPAKKFSEIFVKLSE